MKERAKDLLRAMVVRLPWGARKAVMEALNERYGVDYVNVLNARKDVDYDLLVRHASRANIQGFLVNGSLGLIQSSASDRMILPIYARSGTWAERTNTELAAFFNGRSGTYLDIGANVGLTTIPIARNPQVQCIAFEPDPTNYSNLQDNVRRNVATENVITHQVALFSREGELNFGLADDGNLGDHRIVEKATGNRRTIKVKAMPLDLMVHHITDPLAAKIDVQGAEPSVIAGGSRVLQQARFVIIEFAPFLIAQAGGDYRIVLDFLEGFSRVAILPGEHDGPLEFRSPSIVRAELEAFYKSAVGDEQQFMDLYARRD